MKSKELKHLMVIEIFTTQPAFIQFQGDIISVGVSDKFLDAVKSLIVFNPSLPNPYGFINMFYFGKLNTFLVPYHNNKSGEVMWAKLNLDEEDAYLERSDV